MAGAWFVFLMEVKSHPSIIFLSLYCFKYILNDSLSFTYCNSSIFNYTFYDIIENKRYFSWSLILALIECILGLFLILKSIDNFIIILLIMPIYQLITFKISNTFIIKKFTHDLRVIVNGDPFWPGCKPALLDGFFSITYLAVPLILASITDWFLKSFFQN